MALVGDKTGFFDDTLILSGETVSVTFPNYAIESITGGNVVIKKKINKPDPSGFGEILQRFGANSYNIKISGLLKSDFNITKANISNTIELVRQQYPTEAVDLFRRLVQYEGELTIQNRRVNSMGIEKVVVKSFELPRTQGLYYQKFTLNLLSDALLEKRIDDELSKS